MRVVDANLLIYAVDSDSPRHERARDWLETTLSEEAPVGLAWIVLLAFLRVTTRPGILVHPMPAEAAMQYVDSWLRQPCVQTLVPGPGHWATLRTLLAATGTAGNLTSDAHLAAIALECGGTVYSSDHDFRRFPGVSHVDPLA